MAVDYGTYINSEDWKRRSEAAKSRSGNTCEMCNGLFLRTFGLMGHRLAKPFYSKIPELVRAEHEFAKFHHGNSYSFLAGHHKTYARLGNERAEDIAAVCPACHALITEYYNKENNLEEAWKSTKQYVAEVKKKVKDADRKIRMDEQDLLNGLSPDEFIDEEIPTNFFDPLD